MLIKKRNIGTRLGLGDVDPVQPLNLEHPLMRGVQGFWLPLPHLSGGGRLYDLSPYARHGVLTNMNPATSWGSGPVTPSVHTSGADGERITQPPGSVPLGVSTWTLLLYWIPTFASNDENGIWSNRTSGNTGFFQITERNDGNLRAVVERDGETLVNAGTILQQNVPNMIALKANGTILTIYHNGKLINTQTSSAALSISASSPPQLGAYFDFSGGRSHKGLYLAAQTSKRALSDRDIHSWYDQARRGFTDLLRRRSGMIVVLDDGSEPVLQVPFDQSIGADYAADLQDSSLPADPVETVSVQQVGGDALITWTHPGTNVSSFRIERSIDGAAFTEIAALSATDRSYTDESPGFAYFEYRVFAVLNGNDAAPVSGTITILPEVPETIETHVWLFAHQDDEILCAGGSMATFRQDAHHVIVIATDGAGSGACSVVPGGGDACTFARNKEARAAAAILDIHDVRFYGIADGSATVADVTDIIDELRAEFVGREKVYWHTHSTKDDYGGFSPNGHPDHDAVAEAATQAYEDGKIKYLRQYRIGHLFDGSTDQAIRRDITEEEMDYVIGALAEYRLEKPEVGRYAVAQASVSSALTLRENPDVPEWLDLPEVTLGPAQESENTISVLRDGSAVENAEVIFIAKRILKEATVQSLTTNASGEASVITPKQVDMVGITLEGSDGKVREIREGT